MSNSSIKGNKPTVGLRIDQEYLDRIDEIAKATGKTRSEVMLEAILNYWNLDKYQAVMSDIHKMRADMESRLAEIEKKLKKVS